MTTEPGDGVKSKSTRRQALITGLLFAHVAVVALVVLAVVQCAGCGGVKDKTVARLELADARLTIDQADATHHELALTANGEVRWDGKLFVVVTRNGVLRSGTAIVARVDKYGALSVRGQPTNLAVRPEGEFEIDGVQELTIDRDGTVAGPLLGSLDHPALNLDGAKVVYVGPANARWALLLGFAALVTPALSPSVPRAPVPVTPTL